MKIVLADINNDLCDIWEEDFLRHPHVSIFRGNMLEAPGNTIVSPANSFGFMTGGVDYAISQYLGWHVQERIQKEIRGRDCEELLVGEALSVYTDNDKFPYLISAPTMRVPSFIDGTINAYLATRAALAEAGLIQYKLNANRKQPPEIIPIFTGMGTGTGRMHLGTCSMQMLDAYEEFLDGGFKFPACLKFESLRQRALEK